MYVGVTCLFSALVKKQLDFMLNEIRLKEGIEH